MLLHPFPGRQGGARAWLPQSLRACTLRFLPGYPSQPVLPGIRYRDQSIKAAFSLAALNRFCCQPCALLEVLRLPGHDQRCRGVKDRDIAEWPALAFQNVKQGLGVLLSVAAPQGFGFSPRLAVAFWLNLEYSDLAIFKSGNAG